MFVSPEYPVPESHPVDAVFALLSDPQPGPQMPCEHGSLELKSIPPAPPPQLEPTAPPAAVSQSDDLRSAHEWLITERARLEEYTRIQFDKVQQQHQELMAVHFQREQEATFQAQELNREIQRLAAFSESLDARSSQMDQRETELAELETSLVGVKREVAECRAMRSELAEELAAQRQVSKDLEAQAKSLRTKVRNLKAEAANWDAKILERQSAWEGREADLLAQANELDARTAALDERQREMGARQTELLKAGKEIAALVRKQKSLEKEIQSQLSLIDELRGRVARLKEQENSAAAAAAQWDAKHLASRESWESKEAELAERYSQLESRYQTLETAEQSVKRRMAELDDMENRLEGEFERQEKQLAMDCREIDRLRAMLREHGLDPAPAGEARPRAKRRAIRVE